MVYVPEKNNIRKIIIVSLILLDILFMLLFFTMASSRIRGIIIFLLLLSNLYGAYFLVLVLTLKYMLDEKELVISSAFHFQTKKIPIKEIESWSRRITLLDTVGITFSSARFALGKGLDNNGEQAELFITSSKKVIYLRTIQGNFGISPTDADGFITQLKMLEVPHKKMTERSFLANDESKGRNLLNQLTLYCIILTSILLFIPLVIYFTGLMPPLVQISDQTWLSQTAYLDSVFTRGLIALVMIIFCYAITILLSSIEGKYYYRSMYLPLVLIVIMLFIEINTQLSSLLAGRLLLLM